MFFYKIEGEVPNTATEEDNRKARKLEAHKIAIRTTEFNSRTGDTYCFVSLISDEVATICIITKCVVDPVSLAKKYASFVGITLLSSYVSEITLNSMRSLLNTANRYDYIEDDDEIMAQFDLDKICGRFSQGIDFGENLVNENQSKNELVLRADKYLMNGTLLPELERIYIGRKLPHSYGHPVHYMIETDDFETRREVYRILLDALYANGRLSSRRYAFLDIKPGKYYSRLAYETLYKISDGGSVVIRYLADDDTEDEQTVSGERDTIENICEMAKLFRNRVLTVICLPRECKQAKSVFYEYLDTMTFVELCEDFVEYDRAAEYLRALARDNHIRSDKKLFKKLEVGRGYLATELQTIFTAWYNNKLKNAVYPQYKELSAVSQNVVKSAPKGSAYDELDDMIGLCEAKQVIKKAINYYKMQKLYEEKGVKRDHPAMHMIFSGNPGTAKTTVARLFARIMRENGLVSKGQLIEVGRGDLVGKYVGWTAPAIQAKFKAASGGVLFIDEAYSLVDDRDGSFGDEAINTIVQEMENHRADVVVIFAGYPDKMEGFLAKNPGLRSRIAFHVPFADYTSGELCEIAQLISRKNGMTLHPDATKKLEAVFEIAKKQSDFGNGRYVRNVFEQAKMNQANRLTERNFDTITAADVTTITADDIVLPTVKKAECRIGFC